MSMLRNHTSSILRNSKYTSVAHEQSVLEHNRVIPHRVPRDMADGGGETESHSLVRRPN